MPKAIILGAGASWGSTLPEGLRPPLLKHFFDKAWPEGIRSNTFPKLLKWLYIRFGIPEKGLTSGDWNYEEVLSLVDAEHQFGVAYHGDLESAFEIHTHRERLLEVAEEVLRGSSIYCHRGTCSAHDSLADSLQPGDIVINFNYDVIMDSSLRNKGFLEEDAPWLLGIPFTHSWDDRTFRKLRRPKRWAEKNIYFKLHGAVNWFRGTGMLDGATRKALLRRRVYVPIENLDKGHMPSSSLFPSQEGTVGVEPMIVPPSFSKGNMIADGKRDWSDIWWRAAALMSKCKKWIVIGYSCGHSDVDAHWLLRRAAVGVGGPEIDVIDPYAKAVQSKLTHILREAPHTWGAQFESLQQYVDQVHSGR